MPKETISIADFQKLDLRVGTIIKAEKVTGSEKLMKIEVSLGQESRQFIGGLAAKFSPSELEGKQVVVLVNLETKKMMGLESQGMLLAAVLENEPVLITPQEKLADGTQVR